MADFHVIAAAGRTIQRVLDAAFDDEEPVDGAATRAVLVRSDDFDLSQADNPIVFPALSIFLYRVHVNATMRAAWAAPTLVDGRTRLPLDLHYLLTPWADNAEWEHQILGRAVQVLDETPILSGPLLYPSAAWDDHEALQVAVEDAELDAITRTWDSLDADFRLSVPYVVRVLRLDGRLPLPAEPVRTVVDGLVPEVP
jgi:hypothetical protein